LQQFKENPHPEPRNGFLVAICKIDEKKSFTIRFQEEQNMKKQTTNYYCLTVLLLLHEILTLVHAIEICSFSV